MTMEQSRRTSDSLSLFYNILQSKEARHPVMVEASCPDKKGGAIDSAQSTAHSREHTILQSQMDCAQRNPEPTAKHCRKHFLEPLATKKRCIGCAPLSAPIDIGDGLFAFARTFSSIPSFFLLPQPSGFD